jgi:hypothetical protein
MLCVCMCVHFNFKRYLNDFYETCYERHTIGGLPNSLLSKVPTISNKMANTEIMG